MDELTTFDPATDAVLVAYGDPINETFNGRWFRHYKGGLYMGLYTAVLPSREHVVFYIALKDGSVYRRPYVSFFGAVEHNGKTVQRFCPARTHIEN